MSLFPSCSRDAGTEDAKGSAHRHDPVLAEVEGEKITQSQFETELARRSRGIPNALSPRAQREALLEDLIRRKVALVRARREKQDKNPQTAALVEQLIASRYIEAGLAQAAQTQPPVGNSEVQQYYRSHSNAYRLPAMVRCGAIWLKASAKAEPAKREELRAKAGSIRDAAVHSDSAAFTQLVLQHSEDQSTRYIGGDTGWLKAQDNSTRWPPEVVEAAMALVHPGDVAPLVETPNGFFILRLSERQQESLRPLAEVEEAIRYELQQFKRQQAEQAFFEAMRKGLKIEIYRQALDTLPPPSSTITATVPKMPDG